MKALERFANGLTAIEYWIATPLFGLMLTVMIVQVLFRYFLKLPLPWSEELARYLFVASTFMGAAIATSERSHIEINFTELAITSATQDQSKRMKAGIALNVLRDIATIVILLLVSWQTYLLVVDQISMKQVSTAMSLPLAIVTGSMLLGLLLCIVHSLAHIILNLAGRGTMGYEFAEEEDKAWN